MCHDGEYSYPNSLNQKKSLIEWLNQPKCLQLKYVYLDSHKWIQQRGEQSICTAERKGSLSSETTLYTWRRTPNETEEMDNIDALFLQY